MDPTKAPETASRLDDATCPKKMAFLFVAKWT